MRAYNQEASIAGEQTLKAFRGVPIEFFRMAILSAMGDEEVKPFEGKEVEEILLTAVVTTLAVAGIDPGIDPLLEDLQKNAIHLGVLAIASYRALHKLPPVSKERLLEILRDAKQRHGERNPK